MNGNLNELHVPPNADEADDFAVRREFGLRYDAYREGLVRDAGLREAFVCLNPETQWIQSMRAELLEGRCVQ